MPEAVGLALLVLIPLLGALLPALLARWGRAASAWSSAAVTVVDIALFALLAAPVFRGRTLHAAWSWIPALDLRLSLRLDGLGLVFAGLIFGIGLLVILYAHYYLSERDPLGRFYAFLLLFMGAMLGVVLADNLLLLWLFWELTSLTSFLLIGYWGYEAQARRGARMALAVTGAGGLALLGGLLLIGTHMGSYELSDILGSGQTLIHDPLYPLILGLVLIGAFTKSAQLPFHFWLPNAMAAPTPVSAYLHSATMVNAGVFLLARLFPLLSGTELWFYSVGGVGLVTLLFGAYIALFQHDLKGLLAYSTISHLGLMTMLFGLGTPLGAVAGVFHVINHGIFKASLFMAAGIIEHESGSRDMRQLNGLWRFMPYTATLAIVAAGSMAGVPLLNGFLSKEMFFAETVHHPWLGPLEWLLPAAAVLAGIFSVSYSVRFIHDVFFNGEPVGLPHRPKEPKRYMRVPVEILAGVCLLVGIFPNAAVAPLLHRAATAVLNGPAPEFHLAIWQGITAPFLMSMAALIGGTFVYGGRRVLFRLHGSVLPAFDAGASFTAAVEALHRGAERLTRASENGSLQRYLALLFAAALGAGAVPLWHSAWGWRLSGPGPASAELLGTAFIAAGALATVVWHRRRLQALVSVSVCGLVLSLAFVQFSAPDLALTQLAVELVSTVLLLLALFFLPDLTPSESSVGRKVRDAVLAMASGGGAAALAWTMLHTRPVTETSPFFLAHSEAAGGRNVVNMILVDFRGFDTLGEITVLAMAGIIIYALLDRLELGMPATDAAGRPWAQERHPLILAIMARPILPLALVFSFYIFLRGHNLPGGGFIAGLVTGSALILQYMASGVQWAHERLKVNYFHLIGGGVLLAVGTGTASMVVGAPFLTSTLFHWRVPLVGPVEWGSAMVFDLGVYLVVVGAVMLVLAHLGRLSHLLRRAEVEQGGS